MYLRHQCGGIYIFNLYFEMYLSVWWYVFNLYFEMYRIHLNFHHSQINQRYYVFKLSPFPKVSEAVTQYSIFKLCYAIKQSPFPNTRHNSNGGCCEILAGFIFLGQQTGTFIFATQASRTATGTLLALCWP